MRSNFLFFLSFWMMLLKCLLKPDEFFPCELDFVKKTYQASFNVERSLRSFFFKFKEFKKFKEFFFQQIFIIFMSSFSWCQASCNVEKNLVGFFCKISNLHTHGAYLGTNRSSMGSFHVSSTLQKKNLASFS